MNRTVVFLVLSDSTTRAWMQRVDQPKNEPEPASLVDDLPHDGCVQILQSTIVSALNRCAALLWKAMRGPTRPCRKREQGLVVAGKRRSSLRLGRNGTAISHGGSERGRKTMMETRERCGSEWYGSPRGCFRACERGNQRTSRDKGTWRAVKTGEESQSCE